MLSDIVFLPGTAEQDCFIPSWQEKCLLGSIYSVGEQGKIFLTEDGTGKQTVQWHCAQRAAPGAWTFGPLPGALGGTGGAVQAALWQRPAEICRMFFPCRTVTRVGSRTWLVWPRPSWNKWWIYIYAIRGREEAKIIQCALSTSINNKFWFS